ncbi:MULTISPECIES: NETI motif-containing protein [Staphylococcus]|uniref:NETI motif-containing protein n=1 Tax=Staphylococcus TaxID=1279 RepID=UPI00148F4055|nr:MULTISPECIES: NETI motif-containing protein [Staphylococcus]MBN6853825.1 NETI motif-containing protein [Staphylococcus warneri]MBT2770302.1 NETI motif-containing protein [Staphylococcus warneri]MBX7841213.1 NETI motif-containing protein [Staphylococcus warneri]MCF7595660.1 NETI motif-containing protein [Staphylococcus warneri]MCI2769641.1 NETI motif-containing protein [Staphylococcus warneri]
MSMKYKVNDNETIADCLQRMKDDGYMPTRRIEKPIYKENNDGSLEVLKQDIIFIGKKITE